MRRAKMPRCWWRRVGAVVAAGTALVVGAAEPGRAEEGGAGHYLPGAMSTFVDVVPGRQAAAFLNAFTYYGGSVSATRKLQLGGEVVVGVDAKVYADTTIVLVETGWDVLGADPAFAVAAPYVWVDVSGGVERNGRVVGTRDEADGWGDLEVLPLILTWKLGDVKLGPALAVYFPTGKYEVGELANVGRNYFTVSPFVFASWLSTTIGTEVTAFAGVDFNSENDATDYRTGHQFHLDGSIAQHLPLFGGFIGLGANGWYYQQITGDSGSGAKLGSFEGTTIGVGPVLSYAITLDHIDVVAEVKWLPELDVKHRLEGDTVWAKVGFVF